MTMSQIPALQNGYQQGVGLGTKKTHTLPVGLKTRPRSKLKIKRRAKPKSPKALVTLYLTALIPENVTKDEWRCKINALLENPNSLLARGLKQAVGFHEDNYHVVEVGQPTFLRQESVKG